MKPEQQLKALAELDGLNECVGMDDAGPVQWKDDFAHVVELPNYLASYDAIIPLIQKQPEKIKRLLIQHLTDYETNSGNSCEFVSWYDYSPGQLCEALLRATGKWVEE